MYEELTSLPEILNVKELTAFLGVSRSTAYDLMRHEDFPTLHVNSRLLISRTNLIRWLQEHTDCSEIKSQE